MLFPSVRIQRHVPVDPEQRPAVLDSAQRSGEVLPVVKTVVRQKKDLKLPLRVVFRFPFRFRVEVL